MTIRGLLRRRSRQYSNRAVAFLLVSGALVCIATRSFVVRFVCAVVILIVVVAAFLSLLQIPCSKCGKSLGVLGFKVANSPLGRRDTVPAFCPHCNVSFDEPSQ